MSAIPMLTTSEERTAKAETTPASSTASTCRGRDSERATGPELGEYAESELGENWLETLQTDSTEGGPAAEHELDPTTTRQTTTRHDATESGDRPVADKGSGGPVPACGLGVAVVRTCARATMPERSSSPA